MRAHGLLLFCFILLATSVSAQKLAGTLAVNQKAQTGYTLFTSLNKNNTYLIDNCGNTINSWTSDYASGSTAYLTKTGHMIRAVTLPNVDILRAGGGGGIEMRDWDNNIVWTYTHNTSKVRQHHDIHPMENGNILLIAWQVHTKEESIAAGRNPDFLISDEVWAEEIVEVKPLPPDGYEIVWKWNVWDHLIQDFDPTKDNYGVVSEHPELIDLNYVEGRGANDWVHFNAIDYNAELDQIMVTTPFFDEIWIIDHSTTTEEAATHTGGNANKGGDLLYRWGNPLTYKMGTAADQVLGGPHNGHWIRKGLPHEGKILVFNNNKGEDYSAGDIIVPPMNANGTYNLVNGKFGPSAAEISYQSKPPQKLYSSIMSGVEMQPNGNLLFCPSLQGRFIELTPEADTAWLYKSPISQNDGIAGIDFTPTNADFTSDPTFRVTRYPLDYAGFAGKDLTPHEALEGGTIDCSFVTATDFGFEPRVTVYPNPVTDFLFIEAADATTPLKVTLIDVFGREVVHAEGRGHVEVSTSLLPGGFFIARVNNKSQMMVKRTR